MLSRSTLVVALCAALVRAQSIPSSATAQQLAVVDQEYINSGFAESGNAGFGITLKSEALLTVDYAGTIVENGQAYSKDQVASTPTLYVTPASANVADFTGDYTIILADASSLGDPDVEGNYRHYLANSVGGAAGSSGNTTFVPSGGKVITSYAGPGPIAGTGPHRYCWMVWKQDSSFTAPANLSSTTGPSHWSVNSYYNQVGGKFVAASFFTVENGSPTGSVAATSAVNTAAITAAAGSSSSASGSATTKASQSTTASTTAASTTSITGAASSIKVTGALVLASAAGLAAMLS